MKLVITMEQLNKRIAYLYNLRKTKIENILARYDFSELDYKILTEIWFHDHMSIDELEKNITLNKEIVFMVLKNLEERGYLIVEDDHVAISSLLKSEYRKIRKEINDMDERISKNISKNEYNQLIDSLDILIESYGE